MSEDKQTGRKCSELFARHRSRLMAIARETVRDHHEPEEFVLMCFDAGVPQWGPFIAFLTEVHDFEKVEVDGTAAVIGPLWIDDALLQLPQILPGIANSLRNPDRTGRIRVVVGADLAGVVTFRLTDPDPESN